MPVNRPKFGVDIWVAAAAVVVVLMMIIPLPTFLLDVFIAINFAFSLMILLNSFYVRRPIDFHTFPTLLLLATLLRLGLNVSSTRAILTMGPAFDGKIIRAFGEFVVKGNYVVGLIIFLILLAVQYIVITKGATRVAEVAARFTLDALPGKQISIDNDLNSGLITQEEARRKREELRMEADFYGAMDGASRFIQGDAKVSIIITLIDIIGGLIIGVVMRKEDLSLAAKTYTLFTVGDGLVSQIPSLLTATATGVIITRTAAESGFARDFIKQISLQPKAAFITSAFLFVLGLLPGFPTIYLFLIAGALAYWGYTIHKYQVEEKERTRRKAELEKKRAETEVESVENIINVEPIEINIGYNLIPLVDQSQGGTLLERIKTLRRKTAHELGLLIPPIRIKDDVTLDPSEYVIKIRGVVFARAKAYPNKLLALNPRGVEEEIEGIETREPVYGLPAKWIPESERSKAESLGYDVYDPVSLIVTHLDKLITENAPMLLGRQEVSSMIDVVRERYPAVVEEAMKVADLGIIHKVLQNLLREGVSIRNFVAILEAIADSAQMTNNVVQLTEYVRQALAYQISTAVADENGVIHAVGIDKDLEDEIRSYIHEADMQVFFSAPPDFISKFVGEVSNTLGAVMTKVPQPVLLCSPSIRFAVRDMIYKDFRIPVISYSEVAHGFSVELVGTVSLEKQKVEV